MKVAGFLGRNVSFDGCRCEEKIRKTRHGIQEGDDGPRVACARVPCRGAAREAADGGRELRISNGIRVGW
jgi:hypothetical protein